MQYHKVLHTVRFQFLYCRKTVQIIQVNAGFVKTSIYLHIKWLLITNFTWEFVLHVSERNVLRNLELTKRVYRRFLTGGFVWNKAVSLKNLKCLEINIFDVICTNAMASVTYCACQSFNVNLWVFPPVMSALMISIFLVWSNWNCCTV